MSPFCRQLHWLVEGCPVTAWSTSSTQRKLGRICTLAVVKISSSSLSHSPNPEAHMPFRLVSSIARSTAMAPTRWRSRVFGRDATHTFRNPWVVGLASYFRLLCTLCDVITNANLIRLFSHQRANNTLSLPGLTHSG